MSRKAFTAAVVAATIAWSISLSAFLAPLTAKAASAGSLVKASLPAVYYVGQDGKRYVFPNEKTYKTWYSDFSTVTTITDSELASMSIGGNATYKPGVKMVKITTDPKVYAVDHGGMLRWVKTEALATALYGANWNQMIDDVPDAFFTNYTVGADINSASDFSPSGASSAATSINQDKGLGSSTSVSGTLSAMLSSSQPVGGTLPGGATQVNMLKVDVHNGGSSSVTLDSLTVHRSGAGLTTDVDQVYVYAGNDRLTTGRSINSSTNEASFSGLNLMLAAGETKTIWIAADIHNVSTMGGNQDRLELTSLTSGTSQVSGLPLQGPLFTMSSAQVGNVQVTKSGTITNPKAGQMGAKIAEFQLTAGTQEDLTFNKIALFQGGAISRDKLTNFVLKQAGLTIASISALNSKDLAAFVLANPMTLEKGSSKTFQVYADVSGGARTTDSVEMYLDQRSDLLAVGQTYGYGVQVLDNSGDTPAGSYDGAGCSTGPAAGDCSAADIDAGQLTLTFNGPASKDIASNGKDVELFNFTMAAQSNLEVRKLQLLVDGNGALDDGSLSTPRLTDIKVVDTATGVTVAGPKDATQGTGYSVDDFSSQLDYTEVFNLTAGQSRTFKVTADIGNDTTLAGVDALSSVKVTLAAFPSNGIRNLDNSTYLTTGDIVPNSAIAGNTDTILSPSLTVSASSTPVSQTYIQGSQGVQLLGISLKAGDAGSVHVDSIKVTCYVDRDTAGAFSKGSDGLATCSNDLLSAKLWNGSTQLGDTKSPSASAGAGTGGEMTFDNLNLSVSAGQTVTLVVSGNLAGSVATITGVTPDRLKLDVVANGDVTATDQDSNSFSATGAAINATTTDAGVRMTITDQGQISVALAPDDSESEAGLVVGGSSNAVLAKFRFTAQNEELKLAKARVSIGASSRFGVSSLSLYDGSTLVGGPTAVDSSGNADFSGMNFVVPKDGSKTLSVKAALNTVGPSGAASGLDLQATLATNGGSGVFEVRGTAAGSSTLIHDFTGSDLMARSKILRKTKPTVSVVALPSTTLTNGTIVIARLTVSADAAEQVALKQLSFNAAVNDNGGSALTLANSGSDTNLREVGQSSNIAGTVDYCGGTCTSTGTITILFTNEQTIAAGTSKTYELRATVSGADSSGESVSTNLLGDTADDTGALTNDPPGVDVDGSYYNFVWSDSSEVPHSDTVGSSSSDWTNGHYVKILPSDTQTMTRS